MNPTLSRIGLWLLGLLLLAVVVLGDWVTILFCLFVVLAMAQGYWMGAARIGALFGGLLAGVLLGIPLGRGLEGLLAAVFHTSGATNRILSIALCALASVVLVTVILQAVIKRLEKSRPRWKRYDRLIGSGLGLLDGAVLALLMIWLVLGLEPITTASLVQTESSVGPTIANPVSDKIVSFAQAARDSVVGRWAASFNPLNDLRYVTLLNDGLVVISDPGAREAFISHPAIEVVQKCPSVQEAMQMLADDEALCDVLEAGSMSEKLQAILTSPTLLAVFDQTDIVAEVSPLADGIERAIHEAIAHRTE